MVHIVWEFRVKDEAVEAFRRAYAEGGDWHRLFSTYPGYRGTRLLSDARDPLRFVTIDAWDTGDARDAMLRDGGAEYARLDAAFEHLTQSEREIGHFDEVPPAA